MKISTDVRKSTYKSKGQDIHYIIVTMSSFFKERCLFFHHAGIPAQGDIDRAIESAKVKWKTS